MDLTRIAALLCSIVLAIIGLKAILTRKIDDDSTGGPARALRHTAQPLIHIARNPKDMPRSPGDMPRSMRQAFR